MTSVLVTRPAGQDQSILSALERRGFTAISRSALAIDVLPLPPSLHQQLDALEEDDLVIVVSANAVRALRDGGSPLSTPATWLAVGQATARALAAEGLLAEVPDMGVNSEALLALPATQQMAGRRAVILAGEGGRDLLDVTLAERGAEVQSVALYRRTCDAGFAWPNEHVDVLMVTSYEGWECIANKVPPAVVVLAGSERIAARIRQQYQGDVRAARSPLDEDMLAALESLS